MNLLLLDDADWTGGEAGGLRKARVGGRRLRHVRKILRAGVGDELLVGEAEGQIGRGTIDHIDRESLELSVVLDRDPPPRLAVTLVLALPRPPVLRRSVAAAASLGVERIFLLGSKRVERSFWDASAAQPESLREAIRIGLEQAVDTRAPELSLCRYFRPFSEEILPSLLRGRHGYLAHPGAGAACPARFETPCVVMLGPEGGFLPFEFEKLEAAGLEALDLGPRILRVETALSVLLSRTLP